MNIAYFKYLSYLNMNMLFVFKQHILAQQLAQYVICISTVDSLLWKLFT